MARQEFPGMSFHKTSGPFSKRKATLQHGWENVQSRHHQEKTSNIHHIIPRRTSQIYLPHFYDSTALPPWASTKKRRLKKSAALLKATVWESSSKMCTRSRPWSHEGTGRSKNGWGNPDPSYIYIYIYRYSQIPNMAFYAFLTK